jgi:mannose-6-phosphate isomerase-like protein (cupin superfamily)
LATEADRASAGDVVVLLIVQVVYSSLSYSQLQSNGHELGAPAAACACPVGGDVSSTDLAASIASLVKVYAPNSDDAVIRGIQLPDPANYTPVFDFNEPHSTDLITPYGYAKVANIDNYPATHNQAISQTLFQLEVDGSNSPHHHPDAVEILFLFEGTIEVTRIEPNSGHTYTNVLTPNISVIFPRGHIHFQHNIGNRVARYISSLNSELPGVMSEAQRLCDLPYDAILSMFAMQTASSVWAMCGNAGEPIPSNPIHYKKGVYPSKSVAFSSSTGVGEFFKGPDMKTAKENLRREAQEQNNDPFERVVASLQLHGSITPAQI